MLVVICNCIILTLSFYGLGSLVQKIFKTSFSFFEALLVGLMLQTVLFVGVSFFLPMQHFIIKVWIGITLLSGFFFGTAFFSYNQKTKYFSFFYQWKVVIVLLIIAFQSAHLPSFPDHYSYYLPTVRWAQQFGILKGLANWNYFLGQFSPWHILYAAYDAFVFNTGLALNGWFMMATTLYFLHSVEKKTPQNSNYVAFLYLLFGTLFLDGISPDILPLFLIFFLYFSQSKFKDQNEIVSVVFVFWVVFVKIVYAPLLLLVWIFYRKTIDKKWGELSLIAGTMVVFFVLKNYVLTGYPLFPLSLTWGFVPEWAIPPELFSIMDSQSSSILSLFRSQMGISKYVSVVVAVLFLGVCVFFLLKKRTNTIVKKVLVILIFHVVILSFFSLQLRFYYFGVAILAVIILERIVHKQPRFSKYGFYFLQLLIVSFLFVQWIPTIQFRNLPVNMLVSPLQKKQTYQKTNHTSFDYYRPTTVAFFYEIGDIPLPSNSYYWLKRCNQKYKLQPVLIGEEVKDGFKMHRLQNSESFQK